MYPKVKQSLDYCITVWDPKRKGILEEPHHNTYDIEFWGANGMCTSFYLGALTAMVEISKDLDKPYSEYEELDRHLRMTVALVEPALLFIMAAIVGTVVIGTVES